MNIVVDYIRIGNFGTFQLDGRNAEIDLNMVVPQGTAGSFYAITLVVGYY